jgi:hypothetical protein
MQHSPSWETENRSASQDLLWLQKIYYNVHKNPQLVPTVSQLNPAHIHPTKSQISVSKYNSTQKYEYNSIIYILKTQ